MGALIPIAISVLPALFDLIAGDKVGKFAGTVASAVAAVTGTTDPVAAKAALDADPAKEAALRAKLSDTALEMRRLELAEMQSARQMGTQSGLVAKAQVFGGAAVLVIWSTMHLLLAIRGLPYDNPSLFVTALSGVSGVLGAIMQFFYGNSTAAHAANNRLDKIAGQIAASGTQQPQTPPPMEYLPPPPLARDPVPQDTPADELNARELGEKPRIRRPAGSLAPSSARLDAVLEVTFPEEGGYANHPRDKGGPTNMGITYRTLAKWRGVEPSDISAEDVRALTKAEARDIFAKDYYYANRCDQMAPGVDAAVFDFCVNSGRAVKVIQAAFGVKADGAVGPNTLAALASLPAAEAIKRVCDARLAYVRTLEDWDAFGDGWTDRIGRVRAKALAMAGG